jgi:hypothetical protein
MSRRVYIDSILKLTFSVGSDEDPDIVLEEDGDSGTRGNIVEGLLGQALFQRPHSSDLSIGNC